MYKPGIATLELAETKVTFARLVDGQVKVSYEATGKEETYPNRVTADVVWSALVNAGFVHVDPRPYYTKLSEALTEYEETEEEGLLFLGEIHEHFN